MRIPSKRLCDLCHAELTRQTRVAMTYPLDAEDTRRVRTARATTPPPSLFGLAIERAVPALYEFEFCLGCVEGLLPMLGELKRQRIKEILEERNRRVEELQE